MKNKIRYIFTSKSRNDLSKFRVAFLGAFVFGSVATALYINRALVGDHNSEKSIEPNTGYTTRIIEGKVIGDSFNPRTDGYRFSVDTGDKFLVFSAYQFTDRSGMDSLVNPGSTIRFEQQIVSDRPQPIKLEDLLEINGKPIFLE